MPIPGIMARGHWHEVEFATGRSRGLVGETLHLYTGTMLVVSLIYRLTPAKCNRRSQKSASHDWSEVLLNVVARCVVSIHSPLLSTLRGLAAMTRVIVVKMGRLNSRHYKLMLIILRLLPRHGCRRRRRRERLSAWKCVALEVISEQFSRASGGIETGSNSMLQ